MEVLLVVEICFHVFIHNWGVSLQYDQHELGVHHQKQWGC